MRQALYTKVGYYNDYEDIKNLMGASLEEIIGHMVLEHGHFYSVDEEKRTFDDLKDEILRGEEGDIYIIRDGRPDDERNICEGDFIDIYKFVGYEEIECTYSVVLDIDTFLSMEIKASSEEAAEEIARKRLKTMREEDIRFNLGNIRHIESVYITRR